jgi:hypothetical protein
MTAPRKLSRSLSLPPAFGDGWVLHLACSSYPLELRSDFGTSHSSTTRRTNALIQVAVGRSDATSAATVFGYGEVGLPPKKKGCYLADYDDVLRFVTALADDLAHTALVRPTSESVDPFALLPAAWFQRCRPAAATIDPHTAVLLALLLRLDSCAANVEEYARASRCGVEIAIMDCWGKHCGVPLSVLFGLFDPRRDDPSVYKRKGFYTAALNADPHKIVSVIRTEVPARDRRVGQPARGSSR